MSHREIPIPDQISAFCKLDARGLPITFVTFIHPDTGLPDFRMVDYNRVALCIRSRWCGICGQPLGRLIALIGGPEAVEHRIFSDPPVHPTCGQYAMKACPYLSNAKGKRRSISTGEIGDIVLVETPLAGVVRPDKIALYYTTDYEPILVAAAPGEPVTPALKAGVAKSLTWYE